jgi:hypothetical protein
MEPVQRQVVKDEERDIGRNDPAGAARQEVQGCHALSAPRSKA